MIDAHTHLHFSKRFPLHALVERALSVGVVGCVCCGCSLKDWSDLEEFVVSSDSLKIYPQFGLHPWYVKDVEQGWQVKLRDVLLRNPSAGVGEIGLDNHFKDLADFQSQMKACEEQIEIAAELGRTVTFHCVKAHAETVLLLKRTRFSCPFVMHSFNGSADQVKQLLKCASSNVYFSLGCRFVKSDVIACIPLDRVLAETDSPDQVGDHSDLCPDQLRDESNGKAVNDPSQLPLVVDRIAKAHGITFDEAAKITRENTIRAYSLSV